MTKTDFQHRIPLTLIIIGFIVFTTSCDMLTQVVSTVDQSGGKLTTDQVAQGLKEALRAGTDAAVRKLNATDGYYLDQFVKINLPPETKELITYAKKVPGLDKLIEDVILQINRSAEDAAKQATPIFVNAITSMTISDAWGILNGADTAATGYLREKTFMQLFNLYRPTVKNSLDKPIVAGISANQSWSQLTRKWNQFAGSIAGKLLSVNEITYSLDEYVTKQALRGLFIKVADQEKLIRTDINARTSDLLRRVFGSK
ncbi:MAG: DUF4197 domain-containing protein [Bacteroidales bacterium]|jgi:hypothetical protein